MLHHPSPRASAVPGHFSHTKIGREHALKHGYNEHLLLLYPNHHAPNGQEVLWKMPWKGQYSFPNHDSVLVPELGRDTFLLLLLCSIIGYPNSVRYARQLHVAFIGQDNLLPTLPGPAFKLGYLGKLKAFCSARPHSGQAFCVLSGCGSPPGQELYRGSSWTL